jgi:hypothetical protein
MASRNACLMTNIKNIICCHIGPKISIMIGVANWRRQKLANVGARSKDIYMPILSIMINSMEIIFEY